MRRSKIDYCHAAICQSGSSDVRNEIPRTARPYPHRCAPGNLVVPVHHFQVSAVLDHRVVLGTRGVSAFR